MKFVKFIVICCLSIWISNSSVQAQQQLKPLQQAKAHWVSLNTILWKIPGSLQDLKSYTYRLHYDPAGRIKITNQKVISSFTIPLHFTGVTTKRDAFYRSFPYLLGTSQLKAFRLSSERVLKDVLSGQSVVAVYNSKGQLLDVSALQNASMLDDRFTYKKNDLGLTFDSQQRPHFKLWAPTARKVKVLVFNRSEQKNPDHWHDMERNKKGVWSFRGNQDWYDKFYQYEVEVFVRSTGKIETNKVSDPYSLSLSTNSTHSHIVDLNHENLKPAGWNHLSKPPLAAPEDIVIYELHVRDFSINDSTVPPEYRGKFKAFTHNKSNGMRHLLRLARAGLSHIHLLPVFDIATIEENQRLRQEPQVPFAEANSARQQLAVGQSREKDGFNWGYDPFHYGVPEGSYSTDPRGSKRIFEFREMVKSLNDNGLRVVMDVVYNHTHSAGQNHGSVLDKVVPDYYYRLDAKGAIQQTTCCPDTATEHVMMEKLMVDTLVRWAKAYKVDGFRFDLMGHHTRENMMVIRKALNELKVNKDGVNGAQIYLYGEGWRFGSLNAIYPKEAFHQYNAYRSGIGTFNDRIRDAARGGNYQHKTRSDQGFITGLFYDYNQSPANAETPNDMKLQRARLLNYADIIRMGMVANIAVYNLIDQSGKVTQGLNIPYRGSSTGYTFDPQECVNYISAHDNYSLWDQIAAKAPFRTSNRLPSTATIQERLRMQNLGLSLITLGQGIPFIHAGSDMLRSKSGDGDSYDSGDWFNRLDFSYQSNNWGKGLPAGWRNQKEWGFWKDRLADQSLKPSQAQILENVAHFIRLLNIRKSTPLLRLRTAQQIQNRVQFLNSEQGPAQQPGLIVMHVSDVGMMRGIIDPNRQRLVVAINATKKVIQFQHKLFKDLKLSLHPALKETVAIDTAQKTYQVSADSLLKRAGFNPSTGQMTIPPRTTLVYEERN